jgi:hypothetical protein
MVLSAGWWLLVACTGKGEAPAEHCEEGCETGINQDDTGISQDDTGAGGDTDTGGVGDPCAEPSVTFEAEGGGPQDLTAALTSGDYTTLEAPGRLLVCPGTWYARLLLRAEIEVVGLGAGPEETILSGGESGTILDISGEGSLVSVSNLTLDRGAGLDTDHNSGGGGVYCDEGAAVFIEDAVFTRNFANDGAALYARECTVDLRRVEMTGNLSEDDGGALTLWFSAGTLEDVVIEGNEALDGGGVALFYSEVAMTRVRVADNEAGNFAGGIWVYDGAISMTDSEISGNTNAGDAGGILVYGSGAFDGVSFTDNSAPKGGGIFVYYEAEVEGTGCDFSGNSADDIYSADYSDEGGVSHVAGAGYSFSCAENVCQEL